MRMAFYTVAIVYIRVTEYSGSGEVKGFVPSCLNAFVQAASKDEAISIAIERDGPRPHEELQCLIADAKEVMINVTLSELLVFEYRKLKAALSAAIKFS